MKIILFITFSIFIFLGFLFFSKIQKENDNKNQKLSLDRNGLIYETGTDRPFSGIIKDTIDVIIEFQVVDGIKNGSFKTYFLTGQLEKEGIIKNNKNVGEWKYYFDNGQLETIGSFKENLPHGQWESFYDNGYTKIIGIYKNGKQHGAWKYYDNNGELINIIYYNDGKISVLDSLA
jgi:antitoxin component YwqK of YwqJK toxin-antitoxin module